MIKKIMAFLLVLLVLFSSCSSAFAAKKKDPAPTAEPIPQPTLSPDAPDYDKEHPENLSADQLYALSAVLMTQDKGEVIFEKDADEIRYPASMTKILTVLIALTFADDLNETVVVSENAVNVPADSSTMYLKAGEEIRLIDVIYGTMLLSANDGANVIAEAIAGDIPRFVDLMNTTAQTLGCDHSHFVNPHGYHDDNHYSTARDIAVIAREAMKNETFREIVATTSYQLPRTNKQRSRTITTKTEYMLPGSEDSPNKYYYEFATGIKTGSHSHSGYCFAGSAAKEGVELISVVMFTGRKARWADTIKLMDYGFQTVSSSGGWEYLKIYDGEWTLSYKCDNGFLSWMSVECTKRTARDAFQKSQESGYFVAALTGHSSKTAYIDKISVANNNASIAFSGVFQKGSSENSNRQMTAYMTFTVFPNEKTVYVGYDEYGIIYYSKEEFIKIIKKFNGLGLALTVKNGTLLKAELMS